MVVYTIFMGNPGTGKSTLANSLLGEIRFPSGLSYGGGLTQESQIEKQNDGNFVVDTPGLVGDPKIRVQAAQQITRALQSGGGEYKLIFVVTLEAGRVKDSDSATIKLVLDAIQKEPEHIPYAIIINQLSRRTMKILKNTNCIEYKKFKKVVHDLTAGGYPKYSYLACERFRNLVEKDNILHEPECTSKLISFIEKVPTVHLKPQDVLDVNLNQFEKEKQKFQRKQEKIRFDIQLFSGVLLVGGIITGTAELAVIGGALSAGAGAFHYRKRS